MSETEKQLELTRAQKLVGNIIAGVCIIACGLLLLLVGLGVIGGVSVRQLALPTVLLTVGLVFFATAIVQRNSVSLWISFAFIVPAVVSYLNNFTALSYSQLYPLYVAIPAICSLFTMPMSGVNRDHLKVILLFGVIAGLLALNSFLGVRWGIVLPILLVFVGLCIVLTAFLSRRRKTDNE